MKLWQKLARNQRDINAPVFTVTNAETINSLDADITTATIQNNAIAAIILALKNNGIMLGSSVS